MNKIICGDCLEKIPQYLSEDSVDLIYLDPPYFTGRVFQMSSSSTGEIRQFQDRSWLQKVCNDCGFRFDSQFHFCPNCGRVATKAKTLQTTQLDGYLGWLKSRILECYRVLKDTGSFFIHLDWRSVHYTKVILDQIFGYKNLVNEIIWCYSGGAVPKNAFARKHHTILFYGKSNERTFNLQFDPYSEATTNYFLKCKDFRDKDGYIRPIPRGKHMNDWWSDIKVIQLWSHEKEGFPTQKPFKLLERIIRSASNPQDLVLDPFCGSGTTLVAAYQLNRRWIGIDVSPTACLASFNRLAQAGCRLRKKATLIDYPQSIQEIGALDQLEFENLVANRLGLKRIKENLWSDFIGTPTRILKRIENQGEIASFIETCLSLNSRKGQIFILEGFDQELKSHHVDLKILTYYDLIK